MSEVVGVYLSEPEVRALLHAHATAIEPEEVFLDRYELEDYRSAIVKLMTAEGVALASRSARDADQKGAKEEEALAREARFMAKIKDKEGQ